MSGKGVAIFIAIAVGVMLLVWWLYSTPAAAAAKKTTIAPPVTTPVTQTGTGTAAQLISALGGGAGIGSLVNTIGSAFGSAFTGTNGVNLGDGTNPTDTQSFQDELDTQNVDTGADNNFTNDWATSSTTVIDPTDNDITDIANDSAGMNILF